MGKVFKALNKMQDAGQDGDFGPAVAAEKAAENLEDARQEQVTAFAEPESVDRTPQGPSQVELIPGVKGQWDEKLFAFSEPGSIFSENIRKLRTKIIHPASGKPLKKILITSALPGAGKSFTCANLGIVIAQGLEQHALLVDCDLRRTKLAALFGLDSKGKGLVNYLRDDENLGSLIQKTGLDKLSIIPGGAVPPNPAELLGTTRVGQMFSELESRYDDRFIIIDTPPAMLANEVHVLARHADGVIIVVRWGGYGKDQVKQLVDSLDPEKLVGLVFNGYQTNFFSSQLSGYDEYAQYI